MRLIVLTWLLLIAGLGFNVNVYADSEAFLDPDEAFPLSAILNANASVKLTWNIADGYSLYKHKFKFVSRTPEIDLTAPALPDGIPKHDKAFGNVEIYRGQLQINLPLKLGQQHPEHFSLSVTYQGCADQGVCYLPITKELTFDLSETNFLGTGFSTNELPLPLSLR